MDIKPVKETSLFFSEQIIIAIFSTVIGVFTSWDLFIDSGMGNNINHIFLEAVIVICSILIFFRMLILVVRRERNKSKLIETELKNEIQNMHNETLKLREDSLKYREESQKYLVGMGFIIDKQFESWHLSNSEKEVALLLLKGLSHKEIAEIRKTSEKTIRHQSSQVYSKAQLEGRAQLSAFFLEDLLLPNDQQ